MGQVEKTSYLRYHPHWRKRARFARTIMRSAGVTAADAVGYYLPEWLSPRPRKSIHRTFRCRAFTDTRLSESFLCDYSSYSTVFKVWGYCITFFADVKKKFYRTALSAQHFQQLRGGVRDVFRAGNFQFLAAAEPPADGDQRQLGVAGRGHIYLAVAHIHGIFRADAES